jgi:hypothetical protein
LSLALEEPYQITANLFFVENGIYLNPLCLKEKQGSVIYMKKEVVGD